jgi:hypothetical protein
MIRFLHASDLHLGKPFGRFPEEVRQRLRQARQDSIARLAAAAREGGASHVLLAGDTFDAETPQRTTLRHAMNAMAGAADLTWVLMPGNHDHLKASEIWGVLARERPANVQLALESAPMPLGTGATLLPAPCTARAPGRDLTDWMDGAATGDAIRIGLAHGSIREFTAAADLADAPGGVIAPDRAARAGLDYMGLGDWHGRISVTPVTWYSGTPEPDSFKPHLPAGALLVAVAGQGAQAEVREVATGQIAWQRVMLDLVGGDDPVARLAERMPDLSGRDRVMIEIQASGHAGLAAHAALAGAIGDVTPDFLWADSDMSRLVVTHDLTDLSQIDERGAVRDAAEALADAADAGDAAATAALRRLYAYALELK